MSVQALSHQTAEQSEFRDPNEIAARHVSIKLLREILEYQRRMNHLADTDDADQTCLMNAYRKAIRLRREMLRDLPLPIERSADQAPTGSS